MLEMFLKVLVTVKIPKKGKSIRPTLIFFSIKILNAKEE
jgi:hypothetical protein